MLMRELHPEVKAVDGGPLVDFTASDETVDRYQEVITAAGWELTNYRKNPVFQNAHNYHDVIHTLGRAETTEVRGNALVQRVRFAVDENPMAKIAYELYKGGFLRAVSVGFIPLEAQEGKPGETFRRKFLKQELLEVSAVSIPANPNALTLAVKAGAVGKSDLKELAALLKQLCNDDEGKTARPGDDSGARISGADGARTDEWLQYARTLNEVLRKS